MKEDWEYDFSNPPRIPPPKPRCDCCGVALPDGWYKAMYILPGYVMEYYYCSPDCKQVHHLQLIREKGL